MKPTVFPIPSRPLAALLLLVALGQIGEILHQSEHGIADVAERCATCVHLDQPGQCGAASGLVAGTVAPAQTRAPSVQTIHATLSAADFDARAPPA